MSADDILAGLLASWSELPRRLSPLEVESARDFLASRPSEEVPGWVRLELHARPRAMVEWAERVKDDAGPPFETALEVLGVRDAWPWRDGAQHARCARGVHAFAGGGGGSREPRKCVLCGAVESS